MQRRHFLSLSQAARPNWISARYGVFALIAAVSVLATPVSWAEGELRLKTQIENEAGKPVPNLEIELVPEGGHSSRTFKTNKKGSATIPNLQPAKYKPKLDSEEYRIISITYRARRPDGTRLPGFAENNVPQNGMPTIQMDAFLRADLKIVVGERPKRQASGGLQGVSGASGKLRDLNKLFEARQWDELATQSQDFLGDEPNNGGAHYLHGVAMWKTGNYADAEEHVAKAAELTPDQPEVNGLLAAIYLEHSRKMTEGGQADQAKSMAGLAVKALNKQLRATPGNRMHVSNLFIAQEASGNMEGAIGALDQLIALDPEDARPFRRKAQLQIEMGQPQAAVETLTKTPGDPKTFLDDLYNAAVEMWNKDQLDATIAAMDKGIELAPDKADFYQLKGRAHVQKGENELAIAAMKEYIRLAGPGADVQMEQRLIEALSKSSGGD